jgi:hypothetical protein
MGTQFFPALKGYDKYYFLSNSVGDWKSIPQKIDELDELAEQLGVTSLGSFINVTRDESVFDEETMDELEQDGELIDGVWYHEGQYLWSVEPQWFAPDQGLVTVRRLLSHLRSFQDEKAIAALDEEDWDEDQDGAVIGELEEMEKILHRAQQENKLFRICVSA